MEYNFYLEQNYLNEGRVEARILTAAQAETLGHEDNYRRSTAERKTLDIQADDKKRDYR